jgi:hypothetical protein
LTPEKRTSYSRRLREYLYDVDIYEVTSPGSAGHFRARAVNMVRLEAGQTLSVAAELPDEYGATRDEVCARVDAAVDGWAKDQARSH